MPIPPLSSIPVSGHATRPRPGYGVRQPHRVLHLSTSGATNGEEFTWSIRSDDSRKRRGRTGNRAVDIQWNDHTGNAMVTVVSSLCNQQETATFTVIVSPSPIRSSARRGTSAPAPSVPAELTTSSPGLDHAWTDPNGLQVFNNEFIVQNAGEHEVTVTDGQRLLRHRLLHRGSRSSACGRHHVPGPRRHLHSDLH